jgi:hypothetical protein
MQLARTTALDSLLTGLTAHSHWRRLVTPRLVDTGAPGVWLLAAKRGARILFCERDVNQPFPSYLERRELWYRLSASERDIIVHADAAHTRFVWTQMTIRKGARGAYEEYHLPHDSAALIRARTLRHRRRPHSSDGTAGSRALLGGVANYLPGGRTRPALTDGLQQWIEASDELAPLRELWAILGRIVIFDTRCISGDWLLGAADSLEVLYLAVIGRMRSFLGDTEQRVSRRPEHLSDFRRIVIAVGEHGESRPGQTYVRQLIAQRHLFGLAGSAGELRRLRRRVLNWAGFPPGSATLIDTNIRCACEDDDHAAGAKWARQAVIPPGGRDVREETLVEECEIIGSAWELVARARLADDCPVQEWRTAAARLEGRRRTLEGRWRRACCSQRLSQPIPAPAKLLFPILHGRARQILVVRTGLPDG